MSLLNAEKVALMCAAANLNEAAHIAGTANAVARGLNDMGMALIVDEHLMNQIVLQALMSEEVRDRAFLMLVTLIESL